MADIDEVLAQMNSGFATLHEKIDFKFSGLSKEFQEQRLICLDKFAIIDTATAVKNATNGVEKRRRSDFYGFWRSVFLALVIFVLTGIFVTLWEVVKMDMSKKAGITPQVFVIPQNHMATTALTTVPPAKDR